MNTTPIPWDVGDLTMNEDILDLTETEEGAIAGGIDMDYCD